MTIMIIIIAMIINEINNQFIGKICGIKKHF